MSAFFIKSHAIIIRYWQSLLLLLIAVLHILFILVFSADPERMPESSRAITVSTINAISFVIIIFFAGKATNQTNSVGLPALQIGFCAVMVGSALIPAPLKLFNEPLFIREIPQSNADFSDFFDITLTDGVSLLYAFFREWITGVYVQTDKNFNAAYLGLFYSGNALFFLHQASNLSFNNTSNSDSKHHQEITDEIIDECLSHSSKEKKLVVHILREAVLETKQRANRVLGIIMLLLCAGVLVILFAGQITNLDLAAGGATTALQNERQDLTADRREIRDENGSLLHERRSHRRVLEAVGMKIEVIDRGPTEIFLLMDSFYDISRHLGQTSDSTTYLPQESARYGEATEFRRHVFETLELEPSFLSTIKLRDDSIKEISPSHFRALVLEDKVMAVRRYLSGTIDGMRAANRQLSENDLRLHEINERLVAIELKTDEEVSERIKAMAGQSAQNSSFLIASGITRFGIVAIIVFIIQILVTLYRYNMRLASFYASRLNALVYGENDNGTVEFFAGFFDSKEITFGKDIISPTQNVSEMVRSAIEQAGKAWAAKNTAQ